jgi:arylsulfatase A-like enzyme
MLTGLDDLSHGANEDGSPLPASVPTLAAVLRQHGYSTAGFYSGPYLHPSFGVARGFDEYHDCTSYGLGEALTDNGFEAMLLAHHDVTNPIVQRRVGEWAQGKVAAPFFLFVHLWDVHYDYIPPEKYWRLFDADYQGPIRGTKADLDQYVKPGMNPRDLEHLIALYDGEIRYTDETIGVLLDELRGRGFLDDAIVIVTADHGEEFLEHGNHTHSKTLFEEVVRVPLILWAPDRVGAGRDGRLASITDIAPTILGLLGISGGLEPTGSSLLAAPAGDRSLLLELRIPLFKREKVALRTEERKLVRDVRRNRLDLYDLRADPGEKSPLRLRGNERGETYDVQRRMSLAETEARARGERFHAAAPVTRKPIDPATEERLRNLGYH